MDDNKQLNEAYDDVREAFAHRYGTNDMTDITRTEPGIITQNIRPPIPIRDYDWIAYYDGREEGPQGWGATKAEAVANLKSQE